MSDKDRPRDINGDPMRWDHIEHKWTVDPYWEWARKNGRL